MGFSEKKHHDFQEHVKKAKRALVFFDDDGDGTTSFAMLNRALYSAKGVPMKKTPNATQVYYRKVEEYAPDVVFFLDIPVIPEDFLDKITVPVVWLDHHAPQNPAQKNVHYFNPRCDDDADNRPTSYWTYQFIGTKEELWIATIGCIADWFVPEFLEEAKQTYPDLLPESWEGIESLYEDTPVGKLIKTILFMLKGTTTESLTCIRTFLKIQHPNEILKQTTPAGKLLWKKYEQHARPYERLLILAKEQFAKEKEDVLVFVYENDAMSYTQELSNALLIAFPGTVLLVGRKYQGMVKMSLRSSTKDIDQALKTALEGVDGHGGGHKKACGAAVSADDFEQFLEQFKAALKE